MNNDAEEVIKDSQLTRPYTSTGGRTVATRKLGHMTLMCTTRRYSPRSLPSRLESEHAEVLLLCVEPSSVAEIVAHMRLPVVSIRVLLSDLIDIDAVQAKDPEPYDPADQEPSKALLEALLAGLQRRL